SAAAAAARRAAGPLPLGWLPADRDLPPRRARPGRGRRRAGDRRGGGLDDARAAGRAPVVRPLGRARPDLGRRLAVAGWQARAVSWWETNVANCSLCGQMIPRDVWVSDEGLIFCSPACERLYRSYWVPTYGPKAAADGRAGGGMNRAT